jgi:hypothetical protein
MKQTLTTVGIPFLALTLAAGLAYAAAEGPLKSLSSLTVVDAHGTKIGPVISLFRAPIGNVFAMVAFEVQQQPFVLLAGPLGLGSIGSLGPYFTSGNCSGAPLVPSQVLVCSMIEQPTVSAPGHTVYLSGPDAEPQRFIPFVGTQLTADSSCQPASFDNIDLVPARPVVDLDTLFTPPLSVR